MMTLAMILMEVDGGMDKDRKAFCWAQGFAAGSENSRYFSKNMMEKMRCE